MKIINLQKQLGNLSININDWKIQDGKVHGIIGANGCGKTSISKLILGLLEPENIIIDFETIDSSQITMTSQRPYLMHTSVYENIIYPLKIRRITPNQEEIDFYLTKFNLFHKKNEYAPRLSSGERQKLSLIRSLIFHPQLIIIDESLSNLDMESVRLFENTINDIQKNSPVTWIIISHQLAQIQRMCDRVHFVDNGSILESGTVEDMLFKCDNERLKKYIDANILSFKEK